MGEKLTLEKIKTNLKTINDTVIVIDDVYKNNKTPLRCACRKCEHIWYATWTNLQKGKACPKCKVKIISEKLRLDKTNVKVNLDKIGFVLLDSYYHNNMLKVIVEDSDGYHHDYYYRNLVNGKKPSPFGNNSRFKKHNLKVLCKKNNSKYIKHRDLKAHTEVFIQCNSNHKYWVNVYSLKKGIGCWTCWVENHKGINSVFYNPNLTNEERIKTRYQLDGNNHINWSKEVYRRDWYKCKICGSNKNINAHHLNSYHAFPDERFDVNNGITLCFEHHKEFHKQFGYRNNTREQFEEYLKHAQ